MYELKPIFIFLGRFQNKQTVDIVTKSGLGVVDVINQPCNPEDNPIMELISYTKWI